MRIDDDAALRNPLRFDGQVDDGGFAAVFACRAAGGQQDQECRETKEFVYHQGIFRWFERSKIVTI
jgi:hypothetical protein